MGVLTKLIKELNGKDLEIDNKLIKHELDKMQKIYEIGLEYADILKDKFREAGIDFDTFGIDIKNELVDVFSKKIKF